MAGLSDPQVNRVFEALPYFDTTDEAPRVTMMPHTFATERSPPPHRFGVFLGWEWGAMASNGFYDAARNLSPEQWHEANVFRFDHQGGGHACVSLYCIARPVRITSGFERFSERLCADYNLAGHWLGPDGSAGYFQEVARYRERLSDSAYATENAFSDGQPGLIEAMYALDATPNNLRRILAEPARDLRALAPLLEYPALARTMLVLVVADSID